MLKDNNFYQVAIGEVENLDYVNLLNSSFVENEKEKVAYSCFSVFLQRAMNEIFHKFATKIAAATGAGGAFVLALTAVVVWACTGPLFQFSDTWQLVINTSTTIITFLMVFLIQNTQNRDSKAMQLKLDELIRVSGKARDSFVELEDMTDNDLYLLDQEFHDLHKKTDTSPLLHKLHAKISSEHKRRISTKKV